NQSNASTVNNTATSFSVSSIPEGYHFWNVSCTDDSANTGLGAARNFTIDLTNPSIILNSPTNNSETSSNSMTFNYSVVDNFSSILNCSLYVDGTLQDANSSISNGSSVAISISNLNSGSHNWTVSCNDLSNNSNSKTNLFSISVPVVSSGGGSVPIKSLSADFVTSCQSNNLTVHSSGSLIFGAQVTIIDNSGGPIASGTTDSNGKLFFNGCGKNVNIYISSSGHSNFLLTRSLVECGQCVMATPEILPNQINVPLPVPHLNQTPKCTSDNDCSLTARCDLGICNEVSGCGKAVNHQFLPYECGELTLGCSSCQAGFTCSDGHTCIVNLSNKGLQNISLPDKIIPGSEATITATQADGTPCINCQVILIDPLGRSTTFNTDEIGSVKLPFSVPGKYELSLIKNGELLKKISLTASVEGQIFQPGQKGTLPEPFPMILIIILVLIGGLAIVSFWLLRTRKARDDKK
ncbi:hypothetical protein HY988_04330, partial [Candidatus Micrarchaeota archaeon]|nr:hypothetical protein [Candidatus Micrarchaeota archaeon]